MTLVDRVRTTASLVPLLGALGSGGSPRACAQTPSPAPTGYPALPNETPAKL